jgi:hypothetical protein
MALACLLAVRALHIACDAVESSSSSECVPPADGGVLDGGAHGGVLDGGHVSLHIHQSDGKLTKNQMGKSKKQRIRGVLGDAQSVNVQGLCHSRRTACSQVMSPVLLFDVQQEYGSQCVFMFFVSSLALHGMLLSLSCRRAALYWWFACRLQFEGLDQSRAMGKASQT